MRTISFKPARFVVSFLALVLFACDKPQQSDLEAPATPPQTAEEQQVSPPAPDSSAQLSRMQIEEIAQAKVNGGKIVTEKIEHENGRVIYEIELKNEAGISELEIDAATGEVLEVTDKTADFESEGKVLPDELPDLAARDAAEQAALAALPGEAFEWRIRDKGEGAYFSFTIRANDGNIHKVKVAVGTNEIISQE